MFKDRLKQAMVEYTGWIPLDSWIRLKKSRNWARLEADFKKMK